jgi:hypothetical protein
MEPGGRTGERLEMVAAKAGNYTLVEVVVVVVVVAVVVVVVMVVVDEINLQVAPIEYLCLVYFHHYYLMLPHCHLGVVVSQTPHWLKPYWLSLAEIHSSTSYVNTEWY